MKPQYAELLTRPEMQSHQAHGQTACCQRPPTCYAAYHWCPKGKASPLAPVMQGGISYVMLLVHHQGADAAAAAAEAGIEHS